MAAEFAAEAVARAEAFLEALAESTPVRGVATSLLGADRKVLPSEILFVLGALLACWLALVACVSKLRLACWGGWYFIASGDKKPKKANDVKVNFEDPSVRRRTVVFIRHGESEWNHIFNKGHVLVRPFRFVVGLVRELAMLLDDQASLFFDSPLSEVGIQQAQDMLTFLAAQPNFSAAAAGEKRPAVSSRRVATMQEAEIAAIVRGDSGNSVVVSSILKRAISTGVIGLAPRLLRTPTTEKIQLMTSLQEISRNVDTLSLTQAQANPFAPSTESSLRDIGDLVENFYNTRLATKFNTGNKKLSQKAAQRQDAFLKWAFDQQQSEAIVVCGHSLWFREFFKSFLPKSASHVAKEKKMVNCGIVAFDLYATASSPGKEAVYRVDPASVKTLYGGFEMKGHGKSKKA
eukprot:TRINITY_DN39218_c0_g1_i1.p1 TRINITY_DN39218_c0_g1~~TRINITY_DN39218_c0_g1_i1.p1  ORF type:complete len:452 (+),score=110.26 TRINITY_DN39218_c0_g1_i1:142-1356(+)